MADILETLVEMKTMDEVDVKAKFGTSSSNVKKVLKALLMEEMASEMIAADRQKPKRKGRLTSDSSVQPAVQKSGS